MKTAAKNYRTFENDDHIYQLDKIRDYFFQEVYFMVSDLIGDYCETFDNLEAAQKDFERIVKEATT